MQRETYNQTEPAIAYLAKQAAIHSTACSDAVHYIAARVDALHGAIDSLVGLLVPVLAVEDPAAPRPVKSGKTQGTSSLFHQLNEISERLDHKIEWLEDICKRLEI